MRKRVTDFEEARRLRADGYSVREISDRLRISKGSISPWVRDVVLGPEAQVRLQRRRVAGSKKGVEAKRFRVSDVARLRLATVHEALPKCAATSVRPQTVRARHRRMQYQAEGYLRAGQSDWLHAFGCALYWAEGSKAADRFEICNSDPEVIRMSLRFLRQSMGVTDDRFILRLSCYTNNGIKVEDIVSYWSELTQIPSGQFRKPSLNIVPISSKQRVPRRLLYGTLTVKVRRSSSLVHHIYGAIQAYGGFRRDDWLFSRA